MSAQCCTAKGSRRLRLQYPFAVERWFEALGSFPVTEWHELTGRVGEGEPHAVATHELGMVPLELDARQDLSPEGVALFGDVEALGCIDQLAGFELGDYPAVHILRDDESVVCLAVFERCDEDDGITLSTEHVLECDEDLRTEVVELTSHGRCSLSIGCGYDIDYRCAHWQAQP